MTTPPTTPKGSTSKAALMASTAGLTGEPSQNPSSGAGEPSADNGLEITKKRLEEAEQRAKVMQETLTANLEAAERRAAEAEAKLGAYTSSLDAATLAKMEAACASAEKAANRAEAAVRRVDDAIGDLSDERAAVRSSRVPQADINDSAYDLAEMLFHMDLKARLQGHSLAAILNKAASSYFGIDITADPVEFAVEVD